MNATQWIFLETITLLELLFSFPICPWSLIPFPLEDLFRMHKQDNAQNGSTGPGVSPFFFLHCSFFLNTWKSIQNFNCILGSFLVWDYALFRRDLAQSKIVLFHSWSSREGKERKETRWNRTWLLDASLWDNITSTPFTTSLSTKIGSVKFAQDRIWTISFSSR